MYNYTYTYIHTRTGSTIVDGPEVPEDRDPAQREAEGPRSSMDYSEFPLLDFSHQKKPEAPASPHSVTAVPCDVQWKGQRSRRRYMEKTSIIQLYTRTGKEEGTMPTENGEH